MKSFRQARAARSRRPRSSSAKTVPYQKISPRAAVSASAQSARRAVQARAAARSAPSLVYRARSHSSPAQNPPVQEPRAVVFHVPVSGSAYSGNRSPTSVRVTATRARTEARAGAAHAGAVRGPGDACRSFDGVCSHPCVPS